jgi:predicted HNH restriction endonuclease
MSLGLKATKVVQAVTPVAITSPWAVTPIAVDTLGYREAMFVLSLSTQATVQTVITLTEGDTSTPTTAITGADLSTTAVHTAEGNVVIFNVNLRKRKRWLRLNFTGGANVVVSAVCILGSPEKTPLGGAERINISATVVGDTTAETCI